MKTYQKMFDLKLNGKTFALFLAENNRIAFLEINEAGEYRYPTYEDFLLLNNVYNNKSPYIRYDIPRYTFEEKVRLGILGILSVVVVLQTGQQISNQSTRYEVTQNETEIVLTESTLPEEKTETSSRVIYVENEEDLTEALGYDSVSIAEIHNTIDANPYLSNEYKMYSHMLVDAININCPNADLRLYYENAKDKKVNIPNLEELQQEFKQSGIAANYCSDTNEMNIPADAPLSTKIHEDAHTITNFYQDRNGNKVARYCKLGSSLDEAMNNRIVNLLTKSSSYKKEEAVLNFYCSCVPFTMEDYINKGIPDLIAKLNAKYPDVDINFLLNTLDKIADTESEFGVYIYLDSNLSFIDELFTICKKNIEPNMANPYKPFTPFAKLFDYVENKELFYEYLDKYNAELQQMGYENIVTSEEAKNKWLTLQDINGFAIDEDGVYPCIADYEEIEKDYGGYHDNVIVIKNGQEINNFFGVRFTQNHAISYLLYSLPENYSSLGTNEYWEKMAQESGAMSKEKINPVGFYLNGSLLFKEMLSELSIQVGLTKDNEIGFIIKDREGNVRYSTSSENLINLSNPINLNFYLHGLLDFDKLELSTYLSPNYLKMFLSESPEVFSNVRLNDDEIKIEPIYILSLIKNNRIIRREIKDVELINVEKNLLMLPIFDIFIQYDGELEELPSLLEILNYYNYLKPDISEYTMNVEELTNIIETYLNEINVNKAR